MDEDHALAATVLPEPERAEAVELDAGHWLEAAHAHHIVTAMFEDHVLAAPAIMQTLALRDPAEAVVVALARMRQALEEAASSS